jgi:hypothetical protein
MMDKLPSPFWAVLLAGMGVAVALSVLFHPGPVNIALAVLTISSNLVSGALGAFAGHASAKADVTGSKAPVTINQSDSQ